MVFQYTKNDAGLYVCGICSETREKQNTMHYHLKKHEGVMPHACSQCDKAFVQKQGLDDHVRIHHSGAEPPLTCPFNDCAKKFQAKGQLRVHIARNHIRTMVDKWISKVEATGNFHCSHCNEDKKSESAILYHVIDHAKADLTMREKLMLV